MAGTARVAPRAAAVALGSVLLGELAGIRLESTAVRNGMIAAGVIVALALLLRNFIKRPSALSAALQFDVRLGLKERLSTAVELSDSPGKFLLLQSQIADAAKRAVTIKPSEAYPLAPSRIDMLVATGAALLLAAWFLMPPESGIRASITAYFEPPTGNDELIGSDVIGSDVTGIDSIAAAERQSDRLGPSRTDRMRSSLEQLQRISNPEAQSLRERLAEAAESLKQTRVARDAGRRLSGEDYEGAADALRRISESLDKLNSGERQELVEGLREAAAATADDQILSSQFSDAADALESFQNLRAAESIEQIAQRIQEAEAILESEQALQRRIDELQRSLGLGETDPAAPQAVESDGRAGQANGFAGGENGSADGGERAGLTSGAQGTELGDIEDLGSETRLDAHGDLEIVELEANQEAPTESFERPKLQLGRDVDVSLNPSAGELGAVRSRRDSNNQIPLDVAAAVSRYFSPSEGQ